jgi:hypothetical protein
MNAQSRAQGRRSWAPPSDFVLRRSWALAETEPGSCGPPEIPMTDHPPRRPGPSWGAPITRAENLAILGNRWRRASPATLRACAQGRLHLTPGSRCSPTLPDVVWLLLGLQPLPRRGALHRAWTALLLFQACGGSILLGKLRGSGHAAEYTRLAARVCDRRRQTASSPSNLTALWLLLLTCRDTDCWSYAPQDGGLGWRFDCSCGRTVEDPLTGISPLSAAANFSRVPEDSAMCPVLKRTDRCQRLRHAGVGRKGGSPPPGWPSTRCARARKEKSLCCTRLSSFS